MRAYRARVSVLADKYLSKPLGEIDLAMMIADLVKGATEFGLEIPADFMLVGKALMTLDGVGKEIDPDLDIFEEVRPFFVDLLRQRYAPERIATDVWRGMEKLSATAYDLPHQLREVMDDLRLGRLTLRTSDTQRSRDVDRLGRRIFAGMIVSSSVLAGSWLLTQTPNLRPVGLVMLIFGTIWLFWHVVRDFRKD